jgi:hypothetical protein
MHKGGRPKESLDFGIASSVIKAIRETFRRARRAGKRATYAIVAATVTEAYPEPRGREWVQTVLTYPDRLTPSTLRETLVRMAGAGLRVPRHLLMRFEKSVEHERRPAMLVLPDHGQLLAQQVAAKLVERRLVKKGCDKLTFQLIREIVEPYERIFATDVGAHTLEVLRGLWVDLEEVFDGRTREIGGRAVRLGPLTQTLIEMRTPKRRTRRL